MLAKLSEQFQKQLPFVAYRRPKTTAVKLVFQHTQELHTVSDFTESGFVFAPFDNTKKAILIPFDEVHSEVAKTTISDSTMHTKTNPSEEAHKQHLELVQKAVTTIQNSEIEKIVLSRKEEIEASTNPFVLFERLGECYPNAFVYLWYHPKVGMWAGATPETLVSVKRNTITTMSLAGTQRFQENAEVVLESKRTRRAANCHRLYCR